MISFQIQNLLFEIYKRMYKLGIIAVSTTGKLGDLTLSRLQKQLYSVYRQTSYIHLPKLFSLTNDSSVSTDVNYQLSLCRVILSMLTLHDICTKTKMSNHRYFSSTFIFYFFIARVGLFLIFRIRSHTRAHAFFGLLHGARSTGLNARRPPRTPTSHCSH